MCGSLSALDEFELCPPSYTFVQAGPRGRSRCPSLHDEYDRNLSFRPASSRLRGVRRIRDKPNTTGASWRGVRFRSARGPSPLWRSVAAWPPAWRPRGEPDGPPVAEESGNCRAQPLPGGWRRCCGSVDREGGGDSCVGAPGGRVHEPYKGWREAMTANLPDSSVQRAHWPPLAPHVNRGCACAQEQDGAGPCRHLWLPAGVLRACLRQALGSSSRLPPACTHCSATASTAEAPRGSPTSAASVCRNLSPNVLHCGEAVCPCNLAQSSMLSAPAPHPARPVGGGVDAFGGAQHARDCMRLARRTARDYLNFGDGSLPNCLRMSFHDAATYVNTTDKGGCVGTRAGPPRRLTRHSCSRACRISSPCGRWQASCRQATASQH